MEQNSKLERIEAEARLRAAELEKELQVEKRLRADADSSLAESIRTLSVTSAEKLRKSPALIVLDHPEAKMPTEGTEDSAGYDLYSVEEVTIWPGKRKTISTGLRLTCPAGTYMRIAPRSGLAHKNGIATMAGVIDRDYLGVVGVILRNTGEEPFSVKSGDRIAQGIFERYEKPGFEQVENLEKTDRGEGGFGSTGI